MSFLMHSGIITTIFVQSSGGDPYRYSPYGPIVYVPCDVSYAAKLGWDPETLPRPPRPNAPM